ncbi:glycoside hydrolase family 88 protein [Simiduia curdlanivorans]|uniref:Glycoside hydrolase family 105 protein n=1 Tax=Simiduia curdlanivorans TaxID=1492769 RepID=A0ABV8V312_9GAMM|nr:glycoside hydrolase family 88 protein [Simiduia curdlanivorans]MDN3637506.1 glycoside hydrolase family 88 protein [Simiduia curdlanivorans]
MNEKLWTFACLAGLLLGCNGEAPSDSHAKAADTAPLEGSLPIHWQQPVSYQAPGTEAKAYTTALDASAIKAVANQVADWQLAQYDLRSNMMRSEGRASGLPQGWMYATWQIGLLAWADASAQPAYEGAVINNAAANQWQLGPRLYHADDHAMGAVYLSLFERSGYAYQAAHLQQVFDQVLAAPLTSDLYFDDDNKVKHELAGRNFVDPACTDRWCWADAIFMAPPVWAQLARVTGDSKYLAFMDKEFWATTEYLYHPEEQLYLRDSRYFERKDSMGRLIYWGRGNGWVLAGIARLLAELPEDYSNKPRYLELFTAMANRLVVLQQADGSWPSSLLEIEQVSAPESSGTGLLVYALAWGVNQGILTDDKHRNAVQKGWASLVNSVHPNGKLGWVQQVAFAPGSATADDTQLYGTGALLLAAAEVLRFSESQTGAQQ